MTNTKAIGWSLLWLSLSILFGVYLFEHVGFVISAKFFACYLIEKLLSMDNLLMFYVIFKYFGFNQQEQRRALNIGLISAFAIRGLFIFAGGYVLQTSPWISYLFASFLICSGIKLYLKKDDADNEPKTMVYFVRSKFPRLSIFACAIVVIELTDIMFSFDSIPASFGITTNPFIVFSANVFALLGLRSLYFVMLNLIEKLTWLEKVISVLLTGVGIKMFIQALGG